MKSVIITAALLCLSSAASENVESGQSNSLGSDMLGSTAKGAALGAAGGAISGGSGTKGAQVGAGIGLIGGALKHGAEKRHQAEEYQVQKDQVVRHCMQGRGYYVLN
ncbi:glycine zipper family protein [Vibrio variabilis]|uniref:glycine zipper family protein n=1 Tax=Vibrio variabilis TaxID=990271 RepID=UPI000DD605FA|nr:glycine zipper family protein [Vibrio variabilis]